MATIYHVRKACDGTTPAHYFYVDQTDTVNPDISCPTHPTAPTRDFVIESIEQI